METSLAVEEGRSQVVPVASLALTPFRGKGGAANRPPLEAEEYADADSLLVYEGADGSLLVIDGFRRLCLAQAKGVIEVEVTNLGKLTEEQVLKRLLRAGLTQVGRDPFEIFDQIVALQKFRPDLDSSRKLGPYIGASHTQVQKLLRLAAIAPETRWHYKEENLDRGELYLLAKVQDPKVQADLANRYVNGDITRGEVGDAIEEANGKGRKRKKPKAKTPKIFDRDVELVLAQVRGLKATATLEQRRDLARRLRAEADAIDKAATAGEVR